MKTLPPLDQASHVKVSREGGVAYLPGRRNSCLIDLDSYAEADRAQLCELLRAAAPRAVAEHDRGHGDQRYFVVSITFRAGAERSEVRFTLAEPDIPDELFTVWQQGTR